MCKPIAVFAVIANMFFMTLAYDQCNRSHEYYDSCAQTVPTQNCDSIGKSYNCPLQPAVCKGACICEKGYYRNKIGDCVPEEVCLTCNGPHEYYNFCAQTCPPQTCESIGKEYHCPIQAAICKGACVCEKGYYRNKIGECISKDNCEKCIQKHEYFSCGPACDNVCARLSTYNQTNCPIVNIACNPMCYCEEGYARDDNNICIPINKCPISCGGDPNAAPGCGINCGRLYSNYFNDDIACPAICLVDGCDCKNGYVYDENLKKCVFPKDCTPTCKINEVYSTCANGGCRKRKCSESILCIDPKKCEEGCICKEGYVRGNDNICIPESQCPVTCNGPHEYYNFCAQTCPPQTCESIGKEYHCPIQAAVCKGACVCEKGYYRNKIGECISKENCEKCIQKHEYFSCGSACDNVCARLSTYNQTNCPIVNIACNPMCYCEEGYARDDNNICIPINKCPISCGGDPNAAPGCGINCGRLCSNYLNDDVACPAICLVDGCDCKNGYVYDENLKKCVFPEDCTPTCKINEVYSTCANGGCRKRKCSESTLCIDPKKCEEGCICKEGYVRGNDNICIPESQCPVACGGDPNAAPGCGINCGRLCSNHFNDDVVCPDICLVDGCDCKNGYVYDENLQKCVLPEDCTPTCKINEVYSTCANGGCRKRKYSESILCIDPMKCEEGCICKEGYVRGNDNICIPKSQCPVSCGGDPNAAPGCGINCGRLCSNYLDNDVVCPDICLVDGCDCKDGYVYDENLKICVLPEDCTSTCKDNEVYSECANGGCRKRKCSEPIMCIDPIKCYGGCICKDGYTRVNNNTCIPEAKCPVQCNKPHEYYDKSASTCPPQTCENIGKKFCCTKRPGVSTGACRCERGYYRNKIGDCISSKNCKQCTEPHEYYDPCPQTCPPQTCESIGKVYYCPANFGQCQGSCRCENGYFRNGNGKCVSENDCNGANNNDDGSTLSLTVNKTEAEAKFNRGSIALSGEFIYQLRQSKPDKNFVTSAVSILFPMAQIALFAKNNALRELLALLYLENKEEIKVALPALTANYNNQQMVVFKSATKYYANLNYVLSNEFKRDSKIFFGASGQNIDFGKKEQAANTINEWISDQTRGKIQNLVSPDSLSAQTVMVLVNAIYFFGNWTHQFNANYTEKRDFTKGNNEVIQLDTMYQENTFKYVENSDRKIQALEMTYKGGNFSLLVILPEKEYFDKTVQALRDPNVFIDILDSLSYQKVKVYIPKMRIDSSINMKEMLQKSNVTAVFEPSANNFNGILVKNEPLFISDAVQKAFIEVNEKGTEAAAATDVVVTTLSAVYPPPEVFIFNANRPFIFYVILNNVPLFCGAFVGAE